MTEATLVGLRKVMKIWPDMRLSGRVSGSALRYLIGSPGKSFNKKLNSDKYSGVFVWNRYYR